MLVVISEESPDLPGVSIEHIPWSLATQERDLASLDVGVMPLADSPWSRGKCAYKLLQYMAAALPVVASPVGMNTQVLVDGENGLAAASEDQWVEALTRLVCDPALSERLGAAGRRTAERYGYPATAARWDPFLRRLARPQTSVLDRET